MKQRNLGHSAIYNQIQYIILYSKISEKEVNAPPTLSFTDPRKPALTFTGNFKAFRASGFSCIFFSSTSPVSEFGLREDKNITNTSVNSLNLSIICD